MKPVYGTLLPQRAVKPRAAGARALGASHSPMTSSAGAACGCVALRVVLLTLSTHARPVNPSSIKRGISASRCAQWQERAYH
jgi:hypothetical protein